MEEDQKIKEKKKGKGRPRRRGRETVMADLQDKKTGNWKTKATNRKKWRGITKPENNPTFTLTTRNEEILLSFFRVILLESFFVVNGT